MSIGSPMLDRTFAFCQQLVINKNIALNDSPSSLPPSPPSPRSLSLSSLSSLPLPLSTRQLLTFLLVIELFDVKETELASCSILTFGSLAASNLGRVL
jgi:hypothetical protein